MKAFTRQPTRGERTLAVVLDFALCVLFAWLATRLALLGMWGLAAIFATLLAITWVLLVRAVVGDRRALNRRQVYGLSWLLLALGLGGFVLAALIDGAPAHRLMVLAGSVTFVSAGLAGVKRRGQDT